MLATILIVLGILIPFAVYFYKDAHANNPALRWKKIAPLVGLEYAADPPRMQGHREGKEVTVVLRDGKAVVAIILPRPSMLRVEVGPTEEVTKRAGMIVPDGVATGDHAFEERLLARCSDKNAGLGLFDPVLRHRLLDQPFVDIVGEGQGVRWTVPEANDPEMLEHRLDILSVIAAEMERYPA